MHACARVLMCVWVGGLHMCVGGWFAHVCVGGWVVCTCVCVCVGWVGGLHMCVCGRVGGLHVCVCGWVGGLHMCVWVLGLMYDEEPFGPNISQVATGGLCLLFSTCCAE